jgi:cell division protein FtsZ
MLKRLHNSKADIKLHLGGTTTNGLGAGADPSIGEAAANESRDEIRDSLTGADMAFVTHRCRRAVPVAERVIL